MCITNSFVKSEHKIYYYYKFKLKKHVEKKLYEYPPHAGTVCSDLKKIQLFEHVMHLVYDDANMLKTTMPTIPCSQPGNLVTVCYPSHNCLQLYFSCLEKAVSKMCKLLK